MAARSTFTRTSGSVITSAWANSLRDHIVAYSGATDGTTEGMLSVNTADDTLRIGNGSAGVQFGCYATPGTWALASSGTQVVQGAGGGNASLASNLLVRYGRHIRATGTVTMSVASGFAGNPITIRTQLPAPGAQVAAGSFLFQDASTGIFYAGTALITAASEIQMYGHNENSAIGADPSFVLEVSDTMWLQLDYFAASAT